MRCLQNFWLTIPVPPQLNTADRCCISLAIIAVVNGLAPPQ